MQKSQENSADQNIDRAPSDKQARQRMIIRRTLMAMGWCGFVALLLPVCFKLGLIRGTLFGVFMILAGGLAGYIIIFVFILTGLNKRFKDNGMTLLQVTWATAVLMVSVYYANQQVRLLFLMIYLVIMLVAVLFAAFRVRSGGFIYITIIALLGYGSVILLLSWNHPQSFNLKMEIIQWLAFALTISGASVVGSELSTLRRMLKSRNIELQSVLKKVNELAITDELTGILNRRHVMDVLKYQKSMADRGDYTFVVCYADLDHFKQVNDHFSHSTGDIVLQKFVVLTKDVIREVDYIARFGGEEFLFILVKTSLPEAVVASERIRKSIQTFSFGDLFPDLHITVSIGVTAYRPGERIEDLLDRADAALYRAKESGRNRVIST
jgi:diguanylate cyclase (GGDEF)-like protein